MADKEKGKSKFLPPKKSLNEAVQVLVRCRPMSDKEMNNEYLRVVDVDPSRGTIDIKNPKSELKDAKKIFTFDAVFDWNASQEDVYEAVRPLVSSVLSGFNGTIFAYGQTGAGKTYTMEGCVNDTSKRGIILRSFDQIFTHISRSKDQQFLVRSSYLEIYQEEIRDLLTAHGTKCEIRERTDSGVYIKDLSTFMCKSSTEITNVMNLGNENRSIGATNMNEHSSRSHAILTVTVEMVDLDTGEGSERAIRVGKLNLVDLAGSERQSKSGAKGDRLKEASKINLSLSALGNVISALVDGRTSHIPYRDSKLTRLLQDSLGGNSKTIMVANIGPASYNYEESLTTLRYAQRAKSIKNKPKVNEDPKDALLREYREEITRLKDLLAERTLKKENRLSDVETSIVQGTYNDTDNKSSEVSEQERKQLDEIERHRKEIAEDKKLTEELEQKIASMESKLLCGGKNIIDHTNEQQRALEMRIQEIAEKKLTEVIMRQQLELQEDTALNIHSSYSSLQQEVEVKTRKLKKLFAKFQAVKQEIQDLTEEFNRDRRDLELTQNELLKEMKKKNMIIENFIPLEVKNCLARRLVYSEEEDDWVLRSNPEEDIVLVTKRPVSTCDRRPISDYSRVATHVGHHYRYQAENILTLEVDKPTRTTHDYAIPVIAPKIMAVLDQALRTEEDLDIDASKLKHSSRPDRRSGVKRSGIVVQRRKSGVPSSSGKAVSDVTSPNKFKQDPVYPKARGLVPKK